MSNEICHEMNPNCIVIACCSEPCGDLKWRIESKLVRIGSRDLYVHYKSHILINHTCPRCNREEIVPIPYNRSTIACSFCKRAFEFQLDHNNEWIITNVYVNYNDYNGDVFIDSPSSWKTLADNIEKGHYIHEHM